MDRRGYIVACISILGGCTSFNQETSYSSVTTREKQTTEKTESSTFTSTSTSGSEGCDGRSIYISASRSELTQKQKDNIKDIMYSNMSEDKKQIIDASIEKSYTNCEPFPAELVCLVNLIEDRVQAQGKSYLESTDKNQVPSYIDSVWVLKNRTYYGLFVTEGDVVISSGG